MTRAGANTASSISSLSPSSKYDISLRYNAANISNVESQDDVFQDSNKPERDDSSLHSLQIIPPIVAAAESGSVSHLQVR